MKKDFKKSFSPHVFFGLFIFTLFFKFAWETFWWVGYSVQPPDNFFEYHKIEPANRYINVGESIFMISFLDVYKGLDFTWSDVLLCKFEDETDFTNLGVALESRNDVEVVESKISRWRWNGDAPRSPATCYIESTITVDVGHGVIKRQKIISDDFVVQ